jgi:hypothetical protein
MSQQQQGVALQVPPQIAAWLKTSMPRVSRLIEEQRKARGAEFVSHCWRRSLRGEPGWFYAREGALAIGTPWPEALDLEREALKACAPHVPAALVVWSPKGQADGA